MAKAAKRDSGPVTAYALAVVRGKVTTGRLVRLTCERHFRDLAAVTDKGGVYFDAGAAGHAVEFFSEFLRLAEGEFEGQPFVLQPWQAFIVGSLFGWKGADGYRRFRTAYCEVGKGNGKSPMAAGIGLYGLIADGEASAEIYSAATARDQARILWMDAKKMVLASPELEALIDVKVGNLSERGGHSFFRVVSSEHRGLDGKRPHIVLIDEVHEHPTALVVDKMRAGTKGRRQALIFEITNSGYDRTSVCWHHHEYSRKVLEGTLDNDSWFAYVCQVDEGDDPFEDEACWVKANPNLGISITEKYLREQVDEARGMPSKQNIVRRLNFCEWTQQNERAIDMSLWLACPVEPGPEAELVGAPCFAGLDLGQSDDFTALVLAWDLSDGRVVVRPRFWIPEAALEKHPNRPYDEWQRTGVLEVTEGSITDYDVVEEAVGAECLEWGVRECAYDKRFASQMALHLEGQGILMVDMPQGFQLNEGCTKLGELIAEAMLCHGDHPVLTWMAGNLVFRHGRNREVRPDKDTPGEKMDGMVALIMALQRMIANPYGHDDYSGERGIQTVGM